MDSLGLAGNDRSCGLLCKNSTDKQELVSATQPVTDTKWLLINTPQFFGCPFCQNSGSILSWRFPHLTFQLLNNFGTALK